MKKKQDLFHVLKVNGLRQETILRKDPCLSNGAS